MKTSGKILLASGAIYLAVVALRGNGMALVNLAQRDMAGAGKYVAALLLANGLSMVTTGDVKKLIDLLTKSAIIIGFLRGDNDLIKNIGEFFSQNEATESAIEKKVDEVETYLT